MIIHLIIKSIANWNDHFNHMIALDEIVPFIFLFLFNYSIIRRNLFYISFHRVERITHQNSKISRHELVGAKQTVKVRGAAWSRAWFDIFFPLGIRSRGTRWNISSSDSIYDAGLNRLYVNDESMEDQS